ncbi:cache domain-containing protein [Chitinivorax sp. PXF-14]|uniref:cache domain-containing protein n=1 Tax=Chitinivorax sp. PXF-14 TaxID=3230488 RepID=UPI0034666E2D
MKLKYKIVALTVLPLLLAMFAIGALVQYRAERLAERQVELIEESFMAAKRAELKHYVELALSSIQPLYDARRDDPAAQEQAKAILRAINYGDDGYFFVYDMSGRNIVHPRQPQLVGRNLWNLTDPQGRHVIQALLAAASRDGDGYQRYGWEKPSTHQLTEKLGYVVLLPRWGWMVGTGIYLDDVERATAEVRERARATVRATLLGLGGVALVAVLLVFAGGLVLNVSEHRLADSKLKALAQRIVNLQEEERARVSRELHDGISQLLVSTKFQFELAQHKLQSGGEGACEALDKGIAGLGDAIGEVRRISHDLRPSILDTLGLSAALTQLANEFEQRTGIAVALDQDGGAHVPTDEAVALFRIAQEAFTNIERHAGAQSVRVKLSQAGGCVRLSVVDDGRGFDPASIERAGGIGLRNIRERVEHLAGRFTLQSRPGRTRLVVSLPLSWKGR